MTPEVARGGAPATLDQLAEFNDILRQTIKPRSEVVQREVEGAVAALVREALRDETVVSADVIETIEAVIARLDDVLEDQINEILHHPDFQKLESSWLGLAYTINNAETDAMLRVKVLNVSKAELQGMMRRYPGAKWDKSPLHDLVYEQNLGTLGGKPFGALIGDYYFDHSSADVALLGSIGKIAEAALAPFIAAAAPSLLDLDSWSEIGQPADLSEIFTRPEYAQWNSLREGDTSRFIGLTLPRVLAREPYSQTSKDSVVEEFAFEEKVDAADTRHFAWMNAAHALAANINSAVKKHGWAVNIRGARSGGTVAGLPTYTFDSGSGSPALKCPTEVSITDRREGELTKSGLIGLIHRQHSDQAVFMGAPALQKPSKFVDDDATASSNLAARLPYMFATSRFAHYLKVMVRERVGQSPTRDQLEKELQTWINKYVPLNPETADEHERAKKPLAAAKVTIIEDDLNPGYYIGKFFLRPHFQLEGMDIGLSLVSKLPKK